MNFNQVWVDILALIPLLFSGTGAVHLLKRLDARLPNNVRATVEEIATLAVQAVEQRIPTATGDAKKQAAIVRVEHICKDLHLPISPSLIDVAIETAVAALPPTYLDTPLNAKPQGNTTNPTTVAAIPLPTAPFSMPVAPVFGMDAPFFSPKAPFLRSDSLSPLRWNALRFHSRGEFSSLSEGGFEAEIPCLADWIS